MAIDAISFDAEVWKPVVGYESLYEVSSLGRVKSLPRVVKFTRAGGQSSKTIPGRVLAPGKMCGYDAVTLYRNGCGWSVRISRVVCEAFHGSHPFEGALVLHSNDVRSDDRADNLRWGTYTDNARDRILNGNQTHGERHPDAKLTDVKAKEIKRLLREGAGLTSLAHQFGVSPGTIYAIRSGRTWKHVA